MSQERIDDGAALTATAPEATARCCTVMGRVLKKGLMALAAILAVFVAVVAMQPADFRVERSLAISAPAADVFAQVNDFHNWDAWSPWAKLDPHAKNSFEGPSSGEGAVFKWSGDGNVGEGSMTIEESRPNELIRIKLEFVRPFAGVNTAEFKFKPEGDQTVVTWSMFGTQNFICKAMGMFISMDKMIGDNFEAGLAAIKTTVE